MTWESVQKNIGLILQALVFLFGNSLVMNGCSIWSKPLLQYDYYQNTGNPNGETLLVVTNVGHSSVKDVGVRLTLVGSFVEDSISAPTIVEGTAEVYRELAKNQNQVKYSLPFEVRPGDAVHLWVRTKPFSVGEGQVISIGPTVWTSTGARTLDSASYHAYFTSQTVSVAFGLVVVILSVFWFILWSRRKTTATYQSRISELEGTLGSVKSDFESTSQSKQAASGTETAAAVSITAEALRLTQSVTERAAEYVADCEPGRAKKHRLSLQYHVLRLQALEDKFYNFLQKRGG